MPANKWGVEYIDVVLTKGTLLFVKVFWQKEVSLLLR